MEFKGRKVNFFIPLLVFCLVAAHATEGNNDHENKVQQVIKEVFEFCNESVVVLKNIKGQLLSACSQKLNEQLDRFELARSVNRNCLTSVSKELANTVEAIRNDMKNYNYTKIGFDITVSSLGSFTDGKALLDMYKSCKDNFDLAAQTRCYLDVNPKAESYLQTVQKFMQQFNESLDADMVAAKSCSYGALGTAFLKFDELHTSFLECTSKQYHPNY